MVTAKGKGKDHRSLNSPKLFTLTTRLSTGGNGCLPNYSKCFDAIQNFQHPIQTPTLRKCPPPFQNRSPKPAGSKPNSNHQTVPQRDNNKKCDHAAWNAADEKVAHFEIPPARLRVLHHNRGCDKVNGQLLLNNNRPPCVEKGV